MALKTYSPLALEDNAIQEPFVHGYNGKPQNSEGGKDNFYEMVAVAFCETALLKSFQNLNQSKS